MLNRQGMKWNREETILAFELYLRTPFSKIVQTNPGIVELASLLGRTPGSVGLKMHNLAHHDPALQRRNVSAMSHGSKLDLDIFNEFYNNYSDLVVQANLIKAQMQNKQLVDMIDDDSKQDIMIIPEGQTRDRMVKTRLGQYFFRSAVLNAYGKKCCVTGISEPQLLVASHIKPWAVSDDKTEKTNPSNGLCLNALHDMAFDKGFITINKKHQIIISKHIKDVQMDNKTRNWFMSYDHHTIVEPDKNIFIPGNQFIQYHNDVIFKG